MKEYRTRPQAKAKHQARNRARATTAEHKVYMLRFRLAAKYGLALEVYDAMLAAQGGLCVLCQQPFATRKSMKPCVDHDHKTGKVRGIIHGRCNSGIGLLNDDVKMLEAAIFYLRWFGDQR